MCLVREWYFGLLARASALLLSQYRTGVLVSCILSSCNKYEIYNTSEVVKAKALYSDSADDQETTFCFLNDQETRLGPRKMQ